MYIFSIESDKTDYYSDFIDNDAATQVSGVCLGKIASPC